jgi:hypothetical protein
MGSCEPLTANCFSIYKVVSNAQDGIVFATQESPYIFEVVRLLWIEVGWGCHRHDGGWRGLLEIGSSVVGRRKMHSPTTEEKL